MASIALYLPKNSGDDRCRFRVEWTDNDGLTKERYFRSYRSAERYALKKETVLLNELIADISSGVGSPIAHQTKQRSVT